MPTFGAATRNRGDSLGASLDKSFNKEGIPSVDTADLHNALNVTPPMPVPESPEVRRGLRALARLSQAQVAHAVGVEPLTVFRWERGTRPQGRHADAYGRLLSVCRSIAAPVTEAIQGEMRACQTDTAQRPEGRDAEQSESVEPVSEVDSLRSQVATLTKELAILQRQADALAYVRAYSFPASDPEYSQSFMASLKGRSHLSEAQIAVVEQIRDQENWTRLITPYKGRRTTVLLRPSS